MATSDQIYRTEAARTDFEVRIWVGGKRDVIDRENIATGQSFTPTVSTTLTSNVTSTSTSVPVKSTAAFSAGGLVIHPHGEKEAFEFIEYSGKSGGAFTGLFRTYRDTGDTDIIWGKHEVGATVSEFYEITGRCTRLSVDWSEDGGAAIWRVKLGGFNYDSFLLDNDNCVVAELIQRPYTADPGIGDPYDAWTPWSLWWLGYIKQANLKDAGDRLREWDAEIEGISQYAAATESPPRHYGKNDLAEGKSITVSSYLADPYLEKDAGEFIGYPSLDGDQVNDGDLGTLWMSDGEPALTIEQIYNSVSINEVLLRPREGYSEREHQWIEIVFKREDGGTEKLKWWSLCTKATTFQQQSWRPIIDQDEETGVIEYGPPQTYYTPYNNFLPLKGDGGINTGAGDFVVLTFNKAKFMEKYPDVQENRVYDIRGWQQGTFSLDTTGDFLLLKNLGVTTRSNVWWSDGNGDWESIAPYMTNDNEPPYWTGAMMPVPPRGHSFRRSPAGNAPNISGSSQKDNLSYWVQDEKDPTPGTHTSGEPEWLSVDIGTMGITLEEDVAIGETNTIYLSKQPLGLNIPQDEYDIRYVLINSEIIGYNFVDNDNNTLGGLRRGQGGTSAAAHPAESIVKALDSVSGTATENHKVSAVSWRRRDVRMASGLPIVPQAFEVYTSWYADPIYPDDEAWNEPEGLGGWEDYWIKRHAVGQWKNTSWIGGISDEQRVRHVLILFRKMTDGGRVKINQFHVWAAQVDLIEVPPEADEELRDLVDVNYSAAVIFDILNRDIDLAPSLFTAVDDGRPFVELQTTNSRSLQIIKDICRRTGTSVVFNLDETVEHRYHPLYPLADLETLEITWDRDNTRRISLSRPFRHNVSQAVIKAHESTEEESFEARYPKNPLEYGSRVELEDWVLTDPNDAALMAEYTFKQRNAPLSATLIPVGPAEWVKPGQRHAINWILDDRGELLKNRNFVVTSVRWELNFGGGDPAAKDWRTSITLKELLF